MEGAALNPEASNFQPSKSGTATASSAGDNTATAPAQPQATSDRRSPVSLSSFGYAIY